MSHSVREGPQAASSCSSLAVQTTGRGRSPARSFRADAWKPGPIAQSGAGGNAAIEAEPRRVGARLSGDNGKERAMALTAVAVNCSLKRSGGPDSSTDKMIGLLVSELRKRGVVFAETLRLADFDVKPGVTSDEGEGDDWPDLRRRILAADILIFGTPVWLGQMSSLAKRVVERMDAFLSETDGKGRMPSYGKVAVLAVVGNEDGAHGISAH